MPPATIEVPLAIGVELGSIPLAGISLATLVEPPAYADAVPAVLLPIAFPSTVLFGTSALTVLIDADFTYLVPTNSFSSGLAHTGLPAQLIAIIQVSSSNKDFDICILFNTKYIDILFLNKINKN